jgi:hypothetical protein
MTPDAFELAHKKFFGEMVPVPGACQEKRFEPPKPLPALSGDEQDDLLARPGSRIGNASLKTETR